MRVIRGASTPPSRPSVVDLCCDVVCAACFVKTVRHGCCSLYATSPCALQRLRAIRSDNCCCCRVIVHGIVVAMSKVYQRTPGVNVAGLQPSIKTFGQWQWHQPCRQRLTARHTNRSRDETLHFQTGRGLTQLLLLPECILLLVSSTIDGSRGYTSYLRQPRSLF